MKRTATAIGSDSRVKVRIPRLQKLRSVSLDDLVKLVDLVGTQALARLQLDWVKSEFSDLISCCHMDMQWFSRIASIAVEEESVWAFAQECWHQALSSLTSLAAEGS